MTVHDRAPATPTPGSPTPDDPAPDYPTWLEPTAPPRPPRPRRGAGSARAATVRGRRTSGWFRAFWRWHFYAAFLVVPVLLVLAVTGLIYLFRFQVEPLLHADLMRVDRPANVVAQPYAAQEAAVERAYPGATPVSMTEPSGPDRSTVFSVTTADGAARDVFVNPYGAEVLGSLDPDRTLSGAAILLHGELMAGRLGDAVIEVAACWALVMALTGYYLFVKGRPARRRRRLAGARGARLRSRHGVIGAVTGAGLLMLVVTGLPWTGVWGAKVQELATAQGSSLWSTDPGARSDPGSTLDESLPHSHAHEVPWAMGGSEVPRGAGDGERSVANVDTAVEVGAQHGLRHPMTVALPSGEDGVYSAIGYAFHDPSAERTVHVDRFGGEVVSTYGYDDYPLLAKVVSQGIGLHEGRSLGLLSFWGAALFCLAVVVLCVTGPLMWWRRRPAGAAVGGSVGAPRGRLPLRSSPVLALLVLGLALLLPLFGATLAVVLLLDRLVLRRVPRLRAWFDVV